MVNTDGLFIIIAAAVSFAISALLGKWLVPFMKKISFKQTIRDEGPSWHQSKQGTPIMGGLMFIISSVVVSAVLFVIICVTNSNNPLINQEITKISAGILMALCFSGIGFFDDFIKAVKKRNLGLTAKQKLLLQFIVVIAYIVSLYLCDPNASNTLIPLIGKVDLGWFFWIISPIVIVGMSNATNLTDGIDGLDGSITFFAAMFFMLICGFIHNTGMAVMSAALAGGCLGFLIWNFHPAKIFMGDTGSLFIGGFLCAIAYGIGMPILVIIIGLVYILEMLSVILQVTYFKLTHGKRLFKMSPIHHHFEMCGWSEVKIAVVFSIVTIILGALSLAAVIFTYL